MDNNEETKKLQDQDSDITPQEEQQSLLVIPKEEDTVKEKKKEKSYTEYTYDEFQDKLVQLSRVETNQEGFDIAFNQTVIGRRHVVEDTVCQDYSSVSTFEGRDDCLLCMVSDGHGSVEFSQDGSKIATKVVKDIISDMLNKYSDLEVIELINSLVFKKRVVSLWEQRVISDQVIKGRIKEEEINDDDIEDIVASYGCTLLFVLQIKDTLICGNIGDGEIVLLHSKNNHYKHINEEDTLDQSTLSLSHLRPDFMVVETFDIHDYDYIMVCTDGVSKPFEFMFDELLNNIVVHLKTKSLKGLQESFFNLIYEDYKMLSDDLSIAFGRVLKQE